MERTYSAEEVAEFENFMRDPARRIAFAEVKRKYDRVFAAVFATPWAIFEPYMEVIATVLVEHIANDRPMPEEIAARIEAARRPVPPPDGEGGVAVIPIHGTIIPRASMLAESSGATSIDSIRENFRSALASKAVSAIVLDIDSPGGSAAGIPEFASELRAARGRKPIVAAVSGIGASAAYWLAAQADEVVITPSGLTGSIGVVTAHEDVSKAAEAKGVKVSLISAGKHKTEGNPFEPLSEDARAHTQSMVDDFYAMFVADVAKGRKVGVDEVRNGFGEGRVVNAKTALSLGMVDRIATVEDVVIERLRGAPATGSQGAIGSDWTTQEPSPIAGATGLERNAIADAAYYDALRASFGDDVVDGALAMGDEDGPPGEMFIETDEVVPEAAVDNTAWDGNRAMSACSTAAEYRSICAGERSVGEPDERQHWALPHHYLGRGPNANGVRAALGRIGATENLSNRAAAQAHLERHQAEVDRANASSENASVEAYSAQIDLMKARLGSS